MLGWQKDIGMTFGVAELTFLRNSLIDSFGSDVLIEGDY
jgi:hypothetical protein